HLPGPDPTTAPSERRPGVGRVVLGWSLILLSLPVFAWGVWSGWAALWGPLENLKSFQDDKLLMLLDKRNRTSDEVMAELRGKESKFRTTDAVKALGKLLGGAVLLGFGLELRRRKPGGPVAGASATEPGATADGS